MTSRHPLSGKSGVRFLARLVAHWHATPPSATGLPAHVTVITGGRKRTRRHKQRKGQR